MAAVAWPLQDGVAQGIAGFVCGNNIAVKELRAQLRARLPAHMVPGKIKMLDAMPMNSAGKIDRAALIELLKNSGGGDG